LSLCESFSPKRLAFFVSHSSAGGVQAIWADIAEGFLRRGHAVKLVALYPYGDAVSRSPGVLPWTYIVPVRPTRPDAQLAMFSALRRFIISEKPDRIFTAMPAANALVPVAARLAGSRAGIAISHHSPVGTYDKWLNRFDSGVGATGAVDTVISVSGAVAQSLEGKPGRYHAKSRVIHNALPPEIEVLTAELAPRHPRRGARGRVVVAVGRLVAQKNYPVLIRAAVHMPDVTIRIIGAGPDEAALRALAAKLGVAGRVEFLGRRPREEALAILAEGDVFAQPSLFEGHSLALVEAAKLGMPLVVSDVPVQMEAISARDGGICGIAVDAQDDVGLAREILGLLDGAERYRDYAARARKLAEGITFKAMLDAYEDLVR
jgi:glycosyltransferase involved in cell wall biosynthesis